MELGPAALGNVVGDDLLEAHVGVQEDSAAQDRVGEGVQGAGSEGGDGEGHQGGGEDALGRPVVRALGGIGLRNGSRVVDYRMTSVVSYFSSSKSR